MRIKQLELSGFKSFLDKTKFSFGVPVTTIVGPNGCGKSNVVDALKWITGELSYKELRGRTMEDLIFAGSDKRPPTSMMEVTLVLDNQEKTAPTQFSEFDEITVQRRVFRDGTSEFFINKVPCRLRDITDLFLDTGIGQSSYSIIEQGKVGAIVSGRPEDRRLMIEEAAGITKYKSRKKAAERKIDYTKQNLLRVSDVIQELKKQIASLERQAKKAEAFRNAQAEAKSADLAISSYDYQSLKVNSDALAEEETKQQDLLTQSETMLTQEESDFETKRSDLDEIEKSFRSSQQDLFSLKSTLQDLTNQMEVHERDQKRLEQSVLEETQNIKSLDEAIARTESKSRELQEQVETLSAENQDHEVQLQEKQKVCTERESILSSFESDLESKKAQHIQLVTREAELTSSLTAAKTQQERYVDEVRQHEHEEANLLSEIVETTTEVEKQKKVLDEATQMSFSFQENQKILKEKQQDLEKSKSEIEHKFQETQKRINTQQSKLEALQEFARTYQGYANSVQDVMKNREEIGGIHGVLGEMIQPKKGFEKVIQASLADLIECIVVANPEDAAKAIGHLKNQENRGMFLVSSQKLAIESPRIGHEKVLGNLLDFVEVENHLLETIQPILGDVFVVDGTFQDLYSVWKQNRGYSFVNRDGDLITPEGVIHAGPWSEVRGDLEVRQQISELQAEIEPLVQVKNDTSVELEHVKKDLQATKNQLETIDADLASQSKRHFELSREYEKLTGSVEFQRQKLEDSRVRSSKIKESQSQLTDSITSYENEKAQIESQKAAFESEINDLNEKLSVNRDEYQAYLTDLNEYRVKLASSLERIEGLKREYESSQEFLVSSKENKEQKANLIDNQKQEIQGHKESLEKLIAEKEIQSQTFHEQETSNSQLQTQYDTAAENIRKLENQIRESHTKKEALMEEVSNVRMKISESSLRMENIREQIQERYSIDLLDHMADESYVSIENEQYETFKVELEEHKKKIIKFGNVNLAAIEEVGELKERFEFLTKQRDDLEKSLESLLEAIRKINRTTKEKFESTFAEVNERFQNIFPRLFRGGKAKTLAHRP